MYQHGQPPAPPCGARRDPRARVRARLFLPRRSCQDRQPRVGGLRVQRPAQLHGQARLPPARRPLPRRHPRCQGPPREGKGRLAQADLGGEESAVPRLLLSDLRGVPGAHRRVEGHPRLVAGDGLPGRLDLYGHEALCVQPTARFPERGEAEGAAEAHAGPQGQPRGRARLQVGLREQPLEVNGLMMVTGGCYACRTLLLRA